MLSKGDYLMLEARRREGVYLKDGAAELEVCPRAMRRALKLGGAPTGKQPGGARRKQ
jgi:hypothetical protein